MLEAIPPLPQYDFMAWCSDKAQGEAIKYKSSTIFICNIIQCGIIQQKQKIICASI